ncbi:MAG TPA: hypothetical protein VLK29_11130 [Luteimonas sp.]|nr:hypothetical protein [Luteimonas sp.]
MRPLPVLLGCLFIAAPVLAAEPVPEIRRDAGTAQAVGIAHTLRQIPEACARLEGMFTGQAAEAYRFAAVRTSPNCQPRARFVDAAEADPSQATGWIFNDMIRVANAACPSQRAVVRVWRKPVAQPVKLDGQGQSRIYLEESRKAVAAGRIAAIPMFTATSALEGAACN